MPSDWSEIATYIQEIADDIHGMAANIGEIAIHIRRNAAAAWEILETG